MHCLPVGYSRAGTSREGCDPLVVGGIPVRQEIIPMYILTHWYNDGRISMIRWPDSLNMRFYFPVLPRWRVSPLVDTRDKVPLVNATMHVDTMHVDIIGQSSVA